MDHLPFEQDRMSRDRAAEYLGLKPTTLAADAHYGRMGIPFYRVGGRVFYRRSELDKWLEEHCRVSTKERAA